MEKTSYSWDFKNKGTYLLGETNILSQLRGVAHSLLKFSKMFQFLLCSVVPGVWNEYPVRRWIRPPLTCRGERWYEVGWRGWKGCPTARTPVRVGLADTQEFLCDITVIGRDHPAAPPTSPSPNPQRDRGHSRVPNQRPECLLSRPAQCFYECA